LGLIFGNDAKNKSRKVAINHTALAVCVTADLQRHSAFKNDHDIRIKKL